MNGSTVCQPPFCYFCGGDMKPLSGGEDESGQGGQVIIGQNEVYICPLCGAVLFRGLPQGEIDKINDAFAANLEKIKNLGRGRGNKGGKRRGRKYRKAYTWRRWYER